MLEDEDPIDELHKIRRELYAKAGGTPEAFVQYIIKQQKKYPDGLVDLSKTKVVRNNPCRKPAKPAAKSPIRKSGQRRKPVAP